MVLIAQMYCTNIPMDEIHFEIAWQFPQVADVGCIIRCNISAMGFPIYPINEPLANVFHIDKMFCPEPMIVFRLSFYGSCFAT